MGAVPPARAWAALRSLRADPPARAQKSPRRGVFNAALEQAQQLFEAAAGVGVATKPILVFYGLSQAGRAVAAARATDKWELSGHGIRSAGSRQDERQLADRSIQPGNGGSFGRLVEVLDSSSLPGLMRLGDLWPLLAETERHPLLGSGNDRSLSFSLNFNNLHMGVSSAEIQGLPGELGQVDGAPNGTRSGLDVDHSRQNEAVNRFLSRYPTLAGRQPFSAAGQPIGLQPNGDGTCSLRIHWPDEPSTNNSSREAFAAGLGVRSREQWRVYPSLDGGDRAVHPLLVWWAILFRLSMLARYEPQAWDRLTDVNGSPDAVPLEHLLDTALASVPELIFHELTKESGPT